MTVKELHALTSYQNATHGGAPQPPKPILQLVKR